MLRIAVVFEFGTLNGGENSMLAVFDQLRDTAEFIALAPEAGRLAGALRERGIELVPFEVRDATGNRLSRTELNRRLQEMVQECSPDLIHANSLSAGRILGAAASGLDKPTSTHLRDIVRLSTAAVRDLNAHRRLIAVSKATRQFHVDQGLDSQRTVVVYNGVDCETFSPRARTYSLQQELGVPRDAFLILTVGQIGLRKGQDVLAEAAVQLANRLPNAHYIVVGERNSAKAESVQFERDFKRKFEESGLAHRLHCLGYRNDVPQLMNECHLLVHAAKQEPLGRVLLEAAASGLPIITTNVGGTPEILADGVSGRLIPAGDTGALVAVIKELHGDADLRQTLASAARQQVCQRFNSKLAAQNLLDAWQRIVVDQ